MQKKLINILRNNNYLEAGENIKFRITVMT